MQKKANKVSFSSLSLSVYVCVCLYFSSVPLFLLIFLCIIIQRSNPINRLKFKNALWNYFFSRQEWASDFDQKLIFSFEMFCIHKELFCWLGPYREKQTKKTNPFLKGFFLSDRTFTLDIFTKSVNLLIPSIFFIPFNWSSLSY